MAKAEVIRAELKEKRLSFSSLLLKMGNANFLLLSEREDRLGTLAVAIPQPQRLVGPPTSSVLLGERNMITARILAERLAEITKRISLVSVYVRSLSEGEVGVIMLRLFRKTLEGEVGESDESKDVS